VFTEFDLANYTLNTAGQGPAILDFFAGPGGGGFELSLATSVIIVDALGDQIYGSSGCAIPEQCPTFAPGKFTLEADIPSSGTGTLIITSSTATEPASLALLGTGLLTIAGIVRRKRSVR